ncbi:MAG: biotin/lipoyl-containing protein, partial [Thermoleophilia bacterium]|nr:E3 binding domain-containing protein [Gaiellaceae bacterium]MDW8339184.1 biotin/lipoyl-containing protein [Thermoleophilia bacterium]
MAVEVKLPRLGQGMESGTIVRWLKQVGDQVVKGEPLYELDTDKVTQEVEAEADGTLLHILVPEGEVRVGTLIGVIGAEGEDVSALLPEAAPSGEGDRTVATADARQVRATGDEQVQPEATAPAAAAGLGRVKASPLARRIARERGIELAAVVGTGPEGRIVAEDVEKAAAEGAPAPAPPALALPGAEVEVVPLS